MGKVKKAFGAFLVPLLSVLLAFLIGGIIMAALGANPFLAVKFLFQGAFGSKAGIGTTLTKATPLIFTALCACFAYKCGVFNLGGEGQFLMGSIAAFLTCYFTGLTGFVGVLLALLAGAVAGGFWGMIPGVLKIGRGQNEMIISIMLNYVATLFMGVIYTSWIRDASVPQTPAIADEVHLPRIITGMRFTWGFVIAVAVGLILYYVLFWTSAGFRLRAVGCNLTASRFNGIPVKRFMLASFIVSGAIAGLGGGAEHHCVVFRPDAAFIVVQGEKIRRCIPQGDRLMGLLRRLTHKGDVRKDAENQPVHRIQGILGEGQVAAPFQIIKNTCHLSHLLRLF